MKLRSTPEKTYAEFCVEVHPALLEKMHSIPIRLGSSLKDVLAYGKREISWLSFTVDGISVKELT
jgi:hypothetical protein